MPVTYLAGAYESASYTSNLSPRRRLVLSCTTYTNSRMTCREGGMGGGGGVSGLPAVR